MGDAQEEMDVDYRESPLEIGFSAPGRADRLRTSHRARAPLPRRSKWQLGNHSLDCRCRGSWAGTLPTRATRAKMRDRKKPWWKPSGDLRGYTGRGDKAGPADSRVGR